MWLVKREIVCPGCAEKWRKIQRPTYPLVNEDREGLRMLRGRCRLPLVCDDCGEHLEQHAECWAVSLYREGEYWEWEATRLNLPLAGPVITCAHCRAHIEPGELSCAARAVPSGGARQIELPGPFHPWCCDDAVQAFYRAQREARP
jgi:hypothetical protein